MILELLGIHAVIPTNSMPPILIGKFDTIMGVSIGVNLALGVLSGLQDSIEDFFENLREFFNKKTTEWLQYLVKTRLITEDQAFDKSKSIRKISYIRGSNFERSVRQFAIAFAILEALFCFCFLYSSAIYPETKIDHQAARFFVLSCVAPLGFFILAIAFKKFIDIVYTAYVLALKVWALLIFKWMVDAGQNLLKKIAKTF
jgi:hypothetical protein